MKKSRYTIQFSVEKNLARSIIKNLGEQDTSEVNGTFTMTTDIPLSLDNTYQMQFIIKHACSMFNDCASRRVGKKITVSAKYIHIDSIVDNATGIEQLLQVKSYE